MLVSFIFTLLAFLSSFIPQPTITEGVVGQPRSLNVLDLGANQPDRDIAAFIHRGLMKYNGNGDLVPDLAESYILSADKKEYTFKLRKNLYWHNGKKFNSDDIIYTVSKLNLQAVSVDKLDENTVRFQLSRDPYAPFLDLMTQYLLPSNYGNEEKSGINQVGIGNFRVSRIVKSDKVDSVILTPARPWEKSNYKFSRIIFKFYENQNDLVTAANLGEIDNFGSTSSVLELSNFERISSPTGARYYALYLNLKNESFKDREFRQYLVSLTPKEGIIHKVFEDFAVLSKSPLEYTFVIPSATLSSVRKFDVKFKKEWDVPITITVPQLIGPKSTEGDTYLGVANLVKQAWENGGLKVGIREIPLDKMFTEVIAKKDFDVLLFGQEVTRDPDVYSLWHSTQKDLPGLDFTSYASVLADKSLEEARKENNKEERIKYYQNFLKIFNDEVPAIFLYHPLYTYSFKKDITGPDLKGFYFASDRFANFEQWKRE